MNAAPDSSGAPGLAIEWAGEALTLLPERALWWPRTRTLFIADPHFGKASAFRFAGIPVPETTHDDDLARLKTILHQTGAERLIVLGDFLHSKTGRGEGALHSLAEWRREEPALKVVLVMGNHDLQAGPPPCEWGIECVAEPWAALPFQCCHQPRKDVSGFILAGHLHPACHMSERIGPTLQAPCFWFTPRAAVLPAFGSFTGTHVVHPQATDRVYVVGSDQVIEFKTRRTRN